MRSRQTLWGFLAIGVIPFLLEATTGCDRVFSLDRVRTDNAVNCECSCAAGAPRSVFVARSEDDAEQVGTTMDLGGGELVLGAGLVGLRFADLTIPQGATIEAAYVQFEGDASGQTATTSYKIRAQASTSAASFTNAANDLSGRTLLLTEIAWAPGAWDNGDRGAEQRTPDIASLLQELVDDPGWNDTSSIVLRFEGTGVRTAESFEGSDQQPELIVQLSTGVSAQLPICASTDLLVGGFDASDTQTQCDRVATTLGGIAGACGYPQPCSCTVVDLKDPNGQQAPDTFPQATCDDPCTEVLVDDPACDNFDPNEFAACVQAGGGIASCKVHVAATNAAGGFPICVASGSPLAFHAFGERSQCEVEGSSDIEVGGRTPKGDPATAGLIEVLGEPCPGGSCKVHPYFGLNMDDIEFEVRWASNPVFGDLVATGAGVEAETVDTNGDAVFATDAVFGTGAGRRGSDARAIDAANPDPLGLSVDWSGKVCSMDGGLAATVGDDGACEADPTIPCASDADCTDVGGVCTLAAPSDEMVIAVELAGTLVNQPPSAAAGADQTVECTSSTGAPFTLDGRASSDPDHNLALVSWHQGTRTGPLLGTSLVIGQALGVGASGSFVLRAVDGFAQTDEDETSVEVVDTTPPVIACNAPATIQPRNAAISFGATATDVCDAAVVAAVTSYDCFTFTKKGKRISKLESCVVSFAGNTLSIADVGGYGDHITWTVEAPDDSGNVGQATCEVVIAK
jgi:hypothetical protein